MLTIKIKNMKKYLYSALALPLLFACSSDDLFEKEAVSNDQFAGIEKVDATFSMDEALTRMDDGSWNPQEGDLWGFAWLGDGAIIDPAADGIAYQNHNLIQTSGVFKPQTSIYVGKYYIYRPYDETTVSPQAINFKSLEEQTITEGFASTTQAWKNLAKTAINIGTKWTVVDGVGADLDGDGKIWNKAGIKQNYKLYAAMFSNQTGLDLTYVKNNPTFAAAKRIQGATDIDFTIAAGDAVGAADIYEATVDLDGAAKSFTYAPTASPNGVETNHSGTYWANKSNLQAAEGFTWTDDVITLTPADATNGLSTGDNGSKGWFWFNSLPVTAGTGAVGSEVTPVFETTYGQVTVKKSYDPATAYTVGDCAYAFEQPHGGAVGYETEAKEWIKLTNADDLTKAKDKKTWELAGAHNTFINQYGNHKGKYSVNVDFSKGVMNEMHIKDDGHLQQALKYYIASGKTEDVVLNLDGASDEDKTFKLSKISIALIQSIAGNKVKVQACATHHNPVKIIITQEGSAGKTLVPNLNGVFAAATDVYLAGDGTTWTWSDKIKTGDVVGKLTIDANVNSITNLGTLNVTTTNIELSEDKALANAKGATMNITEVTTVKNALTNLGTINVGSASNTAAELRAYAIEITNDATALDEYGEINNYGVVGVTAGTTPAGKFYNYGYITMIGNGAITLLSSNQTGGATFGAEWAAGNKMGIVELPKGNATALVSVSNATNQGFIKYEWTGKTYETPAGNVKYNTIIVSDDITFTAPVDEIQYIEFAGTRTQVINPAAANLPNLKGIYVHPTKSIIIEKTNILDCKQGAFLGTGATVYKGGEFLKNANPFVAADGLAANNYFGAWSLDQIVEY